MVIPAWRHRREARQADNRETFFETYEGPPEDAPVRSRGASAQRFYRSLILRAGTDPVVYKVNVPNATLGVVPDTLSGLLAVAPENTTPQGLRGTGIKVSRASWYQGDASPRRVRSRWNTSYTRSYVAGSHRSIPLSEPAGLITVEDITDRFNALFNDPARRAALLGTNGRATLELERVPISVNT